MARPSRNHSRDVSRLIQREVGETRLGEAIAEKARQSPLGPGRGGDLSGKHDIREENLTQAAEFLPMGQGGHVGPDLGSAFAHGIERRKLGATAPTYKREWVNSDELPRIECNKIELLAQHSWPRHANPDHEKLTDPALLPRRG